MARSPRIEYPGAVYHVITRGNNRQVIFHDDADRTTYLDKLAYYCAQKEVQLLCYCLLSNHVHLLLRTPQGNLSTFMQPFQTSYTVSFNRRHRHTGHVFEQRYKAFVVDTDHYLLQVSRYIHLNPVRAMLVERPQDYRWSSYRAYVDGISLKGLDRELILTQCGERHPQRIETYREFVEGGHVEDIGSPFPIMQQVFVGDEAFVTEVWNKVKRTGQTREDRYRLPEIVREVCAVVGIDSEALRRASKAVPIQRGRDLFMYLARTYSTASLRDIIEPLGARDVSTVSHGVRRAEDRLRQDQTFHQHAEEVLKRLAHQSE